MSDLDDGRYGVLRSWRYGLVSAHIILSPDLSRNARLLYAVLATYANADRTLWPSRARLISDLGVGRPSIVQAMGELEAAGIVVRTRRASASGRDMTNLITLLDGPPSYPQTPPILEGGRGPIQPPSEGSELDPLPDGGGGLDQGGRGSNQPPSEGSATAPLTEPLRTYTRARAANRDLGDIAETVCASCHCLHTTTETCQGAAARRSSAADAARKARVMMRVRNSMPDVPPAAAGAPSEKHGGIR